MCYGVGLYTFIHTVPFEFQSLSSEWSISLMSAYYPVVLTGASLIVCFWAEVFHLREVRWDRPRFLSKVSPRPPLPNGMFLVLAF